MTKNENKKATWRPWRCLHRPSRFVLSHARVQNRAIKSYTIHPSVTRTALSIPPTFLVNLQTWYVLFGCPARRKNTHSLFTHQAWAGKGSAPRTQLRRESTPARSSTPSNLTCETSAKSQYSHSFIRDGGLHYWYHFVRYSHV